MCVGEQCSLFTCGLPCSSGACLSVCLCRALYEKGVQAFVSFVQSYSKHECSLLFQLKGGYLGRACGWGMWVGHVGEACG